MTDEVKRVVETLRYCEETGARCGECPSGKNEQGIPNCHSQGNIADLIESLAAELEQVENKLSELLYYVTGGRFSKTDYSMDDMRRFVNDYNQCVCDKCDELEQVKQERDALLKEIKHVSFPLCITCKHRNGVHCRKVFYEDGKRALEALCVTACAHYLWRGVQEADNAEND